MTATETVRPDQILPYSTDAEQLVLGSLLLHPERIQDTVARGGISLFFDPFHAEMFRVMVERHRTGQTVSAWALKQVEALQEGLSQFGGPNYLVRLAGAGNIYGLQSTLDLLEELRDRRHLLALARKCEADLLSGEDKPADVAARLEAASALISATSTAVKPVSLQAATTAALEQIDRAYRGETPTLIQTGLKTLDKMIYGFAPGELILLGGRPSMGKTGVALSIALNAARAGHGVIIASLEMMPDALALRAIAEGTGGTSEPAAYAAARRGNLTEQQYRAVVGSATRLYPLPIYFLPRQYAQMDMLYSGIRQSLGRLPPDKLPLVIVDYLQLVQEKGANRFEMITAISQRLKDLAMRLELPILALSQLSRGVEGRDDKRPGLSDLRESGQLEQDADTVMFCYRQEHYLAREEPDAADAAHASWLAAMERVRDRIDIIVAKQRQGETGTARLRFYPGINLLGEDADLG